MAAGAMAGWIAQISTPIPAMVAPTATVESRGPVVAREDSVEAAADSRVD